MIALLSMVSILFTADIQAAVYAHERGGKIVGRLQYTVVTEQERNLHRIARQYQVGYDALMLANPHLDPKKPPLPGTVIYLPHAMIVPALKPNEITINVAEKRMFYLDGKTNKLYIWPVGIGRSHTPTPLGTMSIIHKRKNPTWYVPQAALEEAYSMGYHDHPKLVPPGKNNPLGAHAIALSKRSYLIHSTHDPSMIGTRNTSGCINMYPEDIAQLYGMLSVNDRVNIINQPVKSHRDDDGIFLESHPVLTDYLERDRKDTPVDVLTREYHHHIAEEAFAKNFTGNDPAPIDNILSLLDNPLGVPTVIDQ